MAQHTIQIPITKSAYVRHEYPSTNYGTETVLKTGGYLSQQPDYTFAAQYVALIDWDRQALPDSVNVEGGTNRKKFISAKLKLYSLVTLSGEYNISLSRRDIQFVWSETSAKYSQMPNLNQYTPFYPKINEVNANSYFDISFPAGILYAADYAKGMMIINAAKNNTILQVNSNRATANKPYIELVYEDVEPLPPTLISPKSEVRRNDEVIRFEWQYQSEANDNQTKFDLQWSSNGGQTWNIITQTTSNQYYDMPANTLPVGDIVWRVRTYSQEGLVGEYSDQAAFASAGKPDTPVMTLPNSLENTSRPVIAWTAPSQIMYQAQILQNDGVIWDSGEVASTAGQVQVGTNLGNNTNYTARVRVKNQYDLWSDWATKSFLVNFALPNKPSFDILKDLNRASIRLTITNPTPDGAGGFQHNEIYRREINGPWIRIATGIERNGIYEDCALESGKPYEYKVRTIGTFGYMDSEIKYADIKLRYSQLASISDKSLYVDLKYNAKRKISIGIEKGTQLFAGRTQPVDEFGEHKSKVIGLSATINDETVLERLVQLVESTETLLYRDHKGRKIYCSVDGGLSITENTRNWDISFTIHEVSHQEEV